MDRTARLAFHNTVSCVSAYSCLCVENYIRKVLFYCVSSDLMPTDLIVMGAFRHWICLGELEFVFRNLKILAWKQAMDRA